MAAIPRRAGTRAVADVFASPKLQAPPVLGGRQRSPSASPSGSLRGPARVSSDLRSRDAGRDPALDPALPCSFTAVFAQPGRVFFRRHESMAELRTPARLPAPRLPTNTVTRRNTPHTTDRPSSLPRIGPRAPIRRITSTDPGRPHPCIRSRPHAERFTSIFAWNPREHTQEPKTTRTGLSSAG